MPSQSCWVMAKERTHRAFIKIFWLKLLQKLHRVRNNVWKRGNSDLIMIFRHCYQIYFIPKWRKLVEFEIRWDTKWFCREDSFANVLWQKWHFRKMLFKLQLALWLLNSSSLAKLCLHFPHFCIFSWNFNVEMKSLVILHRCFTFLWVILW